MQKNWKPPLWTVSKGSPFKTSNVISPWIHVSALNSYLCTEFVNEMNSRKKTSVCFQRFMSGFYQINVAVSSPTEFNLEQNLHTSGKFCFQCRIKFQLQFSLIFTRWKYLCRIFFLSSRNIFCEDCIEEITRFVAAVKSFSVGNKFIEHALHARCTFRRVRQK